MSRFKRRILSTGFTIVELLIVIVIIGILSTLVAISYTGISDLARKAALSSNAQSVLRSLKVHMVENEDFNPLTLDETNVQSTLNIDPTGYETLAMYNQAGENYIYIVGKANFTGLIACGVQGSVTVYTADEAACAFGGSAYAVTPVTSDEPGVFGGGNGSTCALAKTISSIEDLVYLATSTNAGNAYSGICFRLTTDLDFLQSKSYVDKNNTTFGDINGNSIVEGLKTELTTAAGFVPIGNSAAKFRGIITGDLHTIYSLYINRPATDYVGLIGYLDSGGKVTTLDLIDVSISGTNYVGGLVGLMTHSRANEIYVKGNVVGSSHVGILAGRLTSSNGTATNIMSSIAEGNVSGVSYIGGAVGSLYESYGTISLTALYKDGSVIATGSNYARVVGITDRWSGAYPITSLLALSSITVNGSTVNSTSTNNIQGASITTYAQVFDDINLAEAALDTYIGGDNDANDYYWDYNGTNTVVRKNTTDNPITFTLAGAGTLASPYIINNSSDLRQASTRQNVYYKLAADIDMSGQKFYTLGSYMNKMTGNFNGDMHTITGLLIDTHCEYAGFIGYLSNGGRVTALNLTNLSVSGTNYVGGLVGFMTHSRASDLYVQGNVNGSAHVGVVVGRLTSSDGTITNITSSIGEGNVSGTSYVGGIAGSLYEAYGPISLTAIYKSGSVTATGTNYARVIGNSDRWSGAYPLISSVAMSSITVNGSTINSNSSYGTQGLSIATYAQVFSDVNLAEAALDTYIGGDNDGSGYYWDYDGTNTVVRKNTTDNPITFTLAGAGTLASPYIINNSSDLRQASTRQNVYYKLASDIDMSGQKFYMLSSYVNKMTGNFNGGAHTITGISVNTLNEYTGFIGYLNNGGRVTALNLTNLSVSGTNYVGGIVGLMTHSSVGDSYVQGNVIGSSHVGIIAGRLISSDGTATRITSSIAEGNVSGVSYVGGVAGSMYLAYGPLSLSSIYKSGLVTATGSNFARVVGNSDRWSGAYPVISSAVVSSITVNGSTVISADPASKSGKDIVVGDLSSQTTYTDRGFNFTDEALDYIWYIDGGVAKFREGTL